MEDLEEATRAGLMKVVVMCITLRVGWRYWRGC